MGDFAHKFMDIVYAHQKIQNIFPTIGSDPTTNEGLLAKRWRIVVTWLVNLQRKREFQLFSRFDEGLPLCKWQELQYILRWSVIIKKQKVFDPESLVEWATWRLMQEVHSMARDLEPRMATAG